jgi:hypothetical protein
MHVNIDLVRSVHSNDVAEDNEIDVDFDNFMLDKENQKELARIEQEMEYEAELLFSSFSG